MKAGLHKPEIGIEHFTHRHFQAEYNRAANEHQQQPIRPPCWRSWSLLIHPEATARQNYSGSNYCCQKVAYFIGP